MIEWMTLTPPLPRKNKEIQRRAKRMFIKFFRGNKKMGPFKDANGNGRFLTRTMICR